MPSRGQVGTQLIDLSDGILVLEARKGLAVVLCLVVNLGVVGVRLFLRVVFDALEHEEDFGGGEGLHVGHAAEFEARGGFFVAGGWGAAAGGLRWVCACGGDLRASHSRSGGGGRGGGWRLMRRWVGGENRVEVVDGEQIDIGGECR